MNPNLMQRSKRWLPEVNGLVVAITILVTLVGWRMEAQGIARVPQDFPTIQAAIDNGPYSEISTPVQNGYPTKLLAIHVAAGIYKESILLRDGSVTLKANTSDIVMLNGSGLANPFYKRTLRRDTLFQADGIIFTNFAMPRGLGYRGTLMGGDMLGVNATSGSNVFINCTFINNQGSCLAGMGGGGPNSLTLSKSVITNCFADGLIIGQDSSVKIEQCIIDNSGTPLFWNCGNSPLTIENSLLTTLGSISFYQNNIRSYFVNSYLLFAPDSKITIPSPAIIYLFNSVFDISPNQIVGPVNGKVFVANTAMRSSMKQLQGNAWFFSGKEYVLYDSLPDLKLGSSFVPLANSPLLNAGSAGNSEFQAILTAPSVDINDNKRDIAFGSVDIGPYQQTTDTQGHPQATATAIVVNGFVVGVHITFGGSGYTKNPNIVISGGGGNGATATATIDANGSVTSITVTNPGSGYTSAPIITIEPPPFPPKKATATSQVVNGFVVGTKITDGGFGYDSPPAVLLIGGGGSGATAVAKIENRIVTAINITNPGTGYTSAPHIRIASPPFSPKLSIDVTRVRVSLEVVLGRKYQIESSTDLQVWLKAGDAFIAQDEVLQQDFDVDVSGRYFRINQVP